MSHRDPLINSLYKTFAKFLKAEESNYVETKKLKSYVLQKLKNSDLIDNTDLTKDFIDPIIDNILDIFENSGYFKTDRKVLKGISLVDPKEHEDWEIDSSKYSRWYKHRDLLYSKGKLDSNAINHIHSESTKILQLLEDPERNIFKSHGLVVGHVQSGKTANFTALVAKALDQGYRFVIVLAGIHNILRQQTQYRIQTELLSDYNAADFHLKPESLTCVTREGINGKEEDGDFHLKKCNYYSFDDLYKGNSQTIIAVIKKNASSLDNITKWLERSSCSPNLRGIPTLIIDDEADQASVNGRSNTDDDPTKINEKIKLLLSKFNKYSYVGYTATPYANFFIPYGNDEFSENDLFPRNFIHLLPEPQKYIGINKIFNNDLENFFICNIGNPGKTKRSNGDLYQLLNTNTLPESLTFAVWDFLFAVVIREFRGVDQSPMSMMIHVTHSADEIDRIIAPLIRRHIEILREEELNEDFIRNRYKIFKSSSLNICDKLSLNNTFPELDVIVNKVKDLLYRNEIITLSLNYKSEDKLDYIKNPKLKVIAIGGNKLSRGLTIEGLMCSYYLRNSAQYDTIHQMGRWFGYRNKYEDLLRIYTSNEILFKFKELAKNENHYRDKIKAQSNIPGSTPKDYRLEVLKIKGMKPTGKGKLGDAEEGFTFFNNENQTLYIPLADKNHIRGNHKLSISFFNILNQNYDYKYVQKKRDHQFNSIIFNDINKNEIFKFINSFNVLNQEAASKVFPKEKILESISEEDYNWDVLFPSNGSKRNGLDNIAFNQDATIVTPYRSRENKEIERDIYHFKSLSVPSDRGATTVNGKRVNPLLIIYFISNKAEFKAKLPPHLTFPSDGIDYDNQYNPVLLSVNSPMNESEKKLETYYASTKK